MWAPRPTLCPSPVQAGDLKGTVLKGLPAASEWPARSSRPTRGDKFLNGETACVSPRLGADLAGRDWAGKFHTRLGKGNAKSTSLFYIFSHGITCL